ncbi:hypothetical protein GC169_11640 [bacterium]|nr:hypothetical protein [bacterium]
MASEADVRRVALALPEAVEVMYRGGPWFNVGKKTFVLFWGPHARWIFKLPKPRQALLFEARSDVFEPYRAGALVWSYVDIEVLSPEEVEDLVTDAWTTIVPRTTARAYLAARG